MRQLKRQDNAQISFFDSVINTNNHVVYSFDCDACEKDSTLSIKIGSIAIVYLLYAIPLFTFHSPCLAQDQTLFNINELTNSSLHSYNSEAISIGLQKYVYGNISDTVDPQKVNWLVIENNPSIGKDIEKYSNVRYLNITVVSKTIDYSFLHVFKKIEILQLNCSVDIPHEISYLQNLQILGILTDRNISFENLKNLPRLKFLSIEEGQIQTIPPKLNTLDSLKTFVLFNIRNSHRYDSYYEAFTTIMDWSGLENNKTIEKIHLELCGLTSIPKEIASCSNLKSLGLKRNLLKDFENLYILTQIEKLSLESSLNKMEELPKELFNLRQLKVLNLRQLFNQLDLKGISKLNLLEELTCNLNLDPGKEQIPEELFNLVSLKRLILRDSRGIRTLAGIEKLRYLEMLNVESCNFRPNLNELIGLPNLKWLNLSNNRVENFTLINQIASIETLVLANCGLQEFSFREGDFKNLKSLNLSNNPDCKIIGPITKLPKFKVLYGSLKLLPENTIIELKRKGVALYLAKY